MSRRIKNLFCFFTFGLAAGLRPFFTWSVCELDSRRCSIISCDGGRITISLDKDYKITKFWAESIDLCQKVWLYLVIYFQSVTFVASFFYILPALIILRFAFKPKHSRDMSISGTKIAFCALRLAPLCQILQCCKAWITDSTDLYFYPFDWLLLFVYALSDVCLIMQSGNCWFGRGGDAVPRNCAEAETEYFTAAGDTQLPICWFNYSLAARKSCSKSFWKIAWSRCLLS